MTIGIRYKAQVTIILPKCLNIVWFISLFFLFFHGFFFLIKNCNRALPIHFTQIFFFFFVLFYFLWLLLKRGFLFKSRPFGSQIFFFIRIPIAFWVRFQFICTLILKPSFFFICNYICIGCITHIVSCTELIIIDTKMLCIRVVSPFKLLFFKVRNRCTSCILKLCKPLLEYHFSHINWSYRPDYRKCATIL